MEQQEDGTVRLGGGGMLPDGGCGCQQLHDVLRGPCVDMHLNPKAYTHTWSHVHRQTDVEEAYHGQEGFREVPR